MALSPASLIAPVAHRCCCGLAVRLPRLDDAGKVIEVVKKDVFQRAKAVVLSANGVYTPTLLLLSATGAFADGLANSHDAGAASETDSAAG